MPCVLLAISLQIEGGDLTSALRSESAAGRSLSPVGLCTEGYGVSWLPGVNGGGKTDFFFYLFYSAGDAYIYDS